MVADSTHIEKSNTFIDSISKENPYLSNKMIGKVSGMNRKETSSYMANHRDIVLASPFYFGSNKYENRHLYKKISFDEKLEMCKSELEKHKLNKIAKLTDNFTLLNKRKPSKYELNKIYSDYISSTFPKIMMQKYKLNVTYDILEQLIPKV